MAKNSLTPNKLTLETIRKTALGIDVYEAKDAADLYKKLGIDKTPRKKPARG
jgi:hypothetical protein